MMMSPTSRTHKLIVHYIFDILLKQTKADVWSEDTRIDVEAITGTKEYKTYVEPDIFLGTNLKWNNETVISTPEIVIEVLSMATAHEDRNEKLELYKKMGVKEYILVSQEQIVIQYNLNNEDYKSAHIIDDVFTSKSIHGIKLSFNEVFKLVRDRIVLFHNDIK